MDVLGFVVSYEDDFTPLDSARLESVQARTERRAVLRDLVDRGQLKVVGAMYDLASGQVDFAT